MNSQLFYPAIADARNDDQKLRDCVKETVRKLLAESTSTGKPGILLGKIQSGKTRAFLGVIAEAFDRGYDIAIVLTKGTISLAEQTIRRIQKDFTSFIESDRVQVFDIMTLPGNLTKFRLNQKLIFVAKKEDDNLRRLINAFQNQYPELAKRRLLIIDDEADYASVTFRKTSGVVSVGIISQQIDELIKLVPNSSFLQVTATPYSLYLQPDESVIKGGQQLFRPKRPAFTQLLPIHSDYVGGDYYFEKSGDPDSSAFFFYEEVPMPERETLKKEDGRLLTLEDALVEKNVRVLRRALMNFVVGGLVRRLQQKKDGEIEKKYSLLIHTEQSRDAHSWQAKVTSALRDQLEQAAKDNTSIFQQLLSESYADIQKSVLIDGLTMPVFRDVEQSVREALTGGYLEITKVNSDNEVRNLLDADGQLQLGTPLSLFIGGQILDRGITVRNLIGFYYGRSPQKFQQETVLQHSRMYGARPKADLAVTRFYAPRKTYLVMQRIHEFDSALREAFLQNEHERGVYFIQKDADNNLIPCSPNRLLFSRITAVKPSGRLLPVGFQTVYKSYGGKKLSELDEFIDQVYGKQYGRVVMVDLVQAARMVELAHENMEYNEDEDYEDDRKGQLASLEQLSVHAGSGLKGKVALIVHVDRDLERIRQDGRISNSPDSYQEKGVAKQAAKDVPALLMLRQNGKAEKGWRDLPFWWPVIFVPQKAVTSIFAADAPVDEAVSSVIRGSEIEELTERSGSYIAKQLGGDRKWISINRAIWRSVLVNQSFRLSDIDSVAKRASVDASDVLTVVGLLCGPESGVLTMNYLATGGDNEEVSQAQMADRLRAWWRDKSITEEEWRSWARGITVEWRPVSREVESSRLVPAREEKRVHEF